MILFCSFLLLFFVLFLWFSVWFTAFDLWMIEWNKKLVSLILIRCMRMRVWNCRTGVFGFWVFSFFFFSSGFCLSIYRDDDEWNRPLDNSLNWVKECFCYCLILK
jgi:hypothetical protein